MRKRKTKLPGDGLGRLRLAFSHSKKRRYKRAQKLQFIPQGFACTATNQIISFSYSISLYSQNAEEKNTNKRTARKIRS